MSETTPPPQPQADPAQAAPQTSATPYPGYPYYGYPYYPYYGYPYPYPAGAQPGKPTELPRSPSEGPGKPWAARVRNLVLAAVAVILTLGAIALAASSAEANGQGAPSPASEGLSQVYSQALVNDSTNWTLDQGCVLQEGGLLADDTSVASSDSSAAAAVCKFVPSTQQDLLSQGFQATVVMAPSGDVPALEEGGIALGSASSVYSFDFTQMGQFTFNVSGSQSFSALGSAIAWHTDPTIANTITIDYAASDTLLRVYVNGQSVFTQSWTLDQGEALGLFAAPGSQALFTNFTLYSAS